MEFLESLLAEATTSAVLFIEAVVLTVIVGATLLAVARMAMLATVPAASRMEHSRRIWLAYARWLVAGLTLQLGADILESSIAPTWHAIAQLGAIAVIRTFLSYFLERDIHEVAERADKHGAVE